MTESVKTHRIACHSAQGPQKQPQIPIGESHLFWIWLTMTSSADLWHMMNETNSMKITVQSQIKTKRECDIKGWSFHSTSNGIVTPWQYSKQKKKKTYVGYGLSLHHDLKHHLAKSAEWMVIGLLEACQHIKRRRTYKIHDTRLNNTKCDKGCTQGLSELAT